MAAPAAGAGAGGGGADGGAQSSVPAAPVRHPSCHSQSTSASSQRGGRVVAKPRLLAMQTMESMQVCRCGNIFMEDAVFCRKCGIKRPDFQESVLDPIGRPIWSWSGSGLGRTPERLLDRNGPFGQSLGLWNVQRWAPQHIQEGVARLYMKDIYHTFLDGPMRWQLLIYALLYCVIFLFFAPLYLWISEPCGLALGGNFGKAYYLSLETMTTIGYGVPDQYFNDCWEGTVVLTFHSLVQYFCNAFVIGSLFVRITRPQNRANTVLFTEKAVIQEIKGAFYFMFQACEAKHHDLVEAQIRCYCIRQDHPCSCVALPMRLQQPDDNLGAKTMLTLPARVIHRIDNWSPLAPASTGCQQAHDAEAPAKSFCTTAWPEAPQRQVDAEQGNKSTCVCPVCGDSFPTFELLHRHARYNAVQDKNNRVPDELSHAAWFDDQLGSHGGDAASESPTGDAGAPEAASGRHGANTAPSMAPSRDDILDFMHTRHIEIVVLLEGIEPTTSCTLQARHSYRLPEDVVWDKTFLDCVHLGNREQPCAVDLSKFHTLVPVGCPDHTPSAASASPARGRVDTDGSEECFVMGEPAQSARDRGDGHREMI